MQNFYWMIKKYSTATLNVPSYQVAKMQGQTNVNNNNKVVTNQGGKVTILWNQQVQTDRTIPNNKPDIIIREN